MNIITVNIEGRGNTKCTLDVSESEDPNELIKKLVEEYKLNDEEKKSVHNQIVAALAERHVALKRRKIDKEREAAAQRKREA